jgi:hypothetical protein
MLTLSHRLHFVPPTLPSGWSCVHEAVSQPQLRRFLEYVMAEEIAPTLIADESVAKLGIADKIPAYSAMVGWFLRTSTRLTLNGRTKRRPSSIRVLNEDSPPLGCTDTEPCSDLGSSACSQ